jgi:hypothetical protein
MKVLLASLEAYYSIFEIIGVARNEGIQVRDLIRGEEQFITDIGFGNTAKSGQIVAGRVVPYPGVLMSTGAAIPMTRKQFESVKAEIGKVFDFGSGKLSHLSKEQETALATTVIRTGLHAGFSAQVEFADPRGLPAAGRPAAQAPIVTERRAGRNDPCPCGSGKKFKVCCGHA